MSATTFFILIFDFLMRDEVMCDLQQATFKA